MNKQDLNNIKELCKLRVIEGIQKHIFELELNLFYQGQLDYFLKSDFFEQGYGLNRFLFFQFIKSRAIQIFIENIGDFTY